jgi:SHS2 domain-containing protein
MKGYEILPHTGDVAVKATGSTREELFSAVLQGMFEAAEPRIENNAKVKREFAVESADLDSLLVDLLNEAIYMSHAHREAYDSVRFSELTWTRASGDLIGRPATGFETEIKAATHYDLSVSETEDGWTATVTFDA